MPGPSAASPDVKSCHAILPSIRLALTASRVWAACALRTAFASGNAAVADEPAGWRADLARWGIELSACYTAKTMAVVQGGLRRGAVINGEGVASATLDLERAAGIAGGRAFASALWLHGSSPSGKLVGDTLGVSNLDGYDSVRLYEVWCEQTVLEGCVGLRAGALLADAEFAGTDTGALFLNSAFGWPAFISANTRNTGPAFYVPAAGVRLRLAPATPWQLQVGVYDGDTFDSLEGDAHGTRHGLHFRVGGQQGWFGIAEATFRTALIGQPTVLKAGAWRHTAGFPDNYRDESGASFVQSGREPLIHAGTCGVYASAERTLRQAVAGRPGVAAHVRAGTNPGDRAAYAWVIDAGCNITGLLSRRSDDVFGMGFVHASVSRDLRRRMEDQIAVGAATPADRPDFEQVIELSYRAALSPGWTAQGDVQWVRHAGTTAMYASVLVLGLRLGVVW